MPTYDFVCPVPHLFERFFRKISDAPTEMPCPECGAIAVRKVSGGAGLVFKGSGFYITDYGKDGKKPQNVPPKKDDTTSGTTSSESGSGGGDAATPTKKKNEASGPKPSSSGGSSGE